MDLSPFLRMRKKELLEYLHFLLWHYRVVDAFWFLYTEEERGRQAAERLNERVWERVSALAARDLCTRFAIKDGGLEGFGKLLRLYPWTVLLDYKIEQSPNQVVVTVPKCATQEARRRRGLPEYACQEMHRREFTRLAQEVDPRIKITCDFAPPGRPPTEPDCRWRFRIEDQRIEPAGELPTDHARQ